jgi:hypothetical protein
MLSLRDEAANARRAADEMSESVAPSKSLLDEARKIDAPDVREPSLFESARAIDAPVSRRAAADVGRAEVTEKAVAERTAADAQRARLATAEKEAVELARLASKAERSYNRLITARKEPADVRLGAQAIRNMRNDMGGVIDPARTIKPNTKRQALGDIYGILNKEIEDVAANTSGVDVAALKMRNRRISTLIPVRDALKARAESQGEQTLMQKAKRLPGDAIRRATREVDYAIGDLPAVPASVPVGVARDRQPPVGVPAGFVAAMRGEQAPQP